MTKIDVSPAEAAAAAQTFAKGQTDLGDIWMKLYLALNSCGGMAGNDKPAHTFTGKYDPGLKAAWNSFGTAVTVLGGVAVGLNRSVNNYLKADHHSAMQRKGMPHHYSLPRIASTMSMASPAPALGAGDSLLPGFLAKYWPNGHQDKLHGAARAWRVAADEIESLARRLGSTIYNITDTGTKDSKAISDYWAKVYAPCNDRTVLAGLSELCRILGSACDNFAQVIDHAHSNVERKLAEAGIVIGLTSLIAGGLTIFTGGASDAGGAVLDAAEAEAILGPIEAETAAATSDVATSISEELVDVVETTAAETPTIESVEAETSELQEAVEGELAAEADTPYSGRMLKVSKPDPNADRLAERIGGESRVRFENDPAGREFDAVSNKYIAQDKPADFQVNKNFRNQAKATFEAAKGTGREVYYHFDGPPRPGVLEKLNEYATRYGVELTVDTNPY
ncbi:restriction endonuclease fold toxin [Actinomadura opuntiae]|uniref:restriction endonuclease fold toxin n=1 Tax=Actinomadura sp. OS1-43 TaxID=604315 RepID=UPI00255B21AD|nr:restriction endonuclease fold toxin [Actinomadura sp. OS1-43]MDL4820782.1 restriction endonuclease fold toxin [Actinomadura sp. OS1-43]